MKIRTFIRGFLSLALVALISSAAFAGSNIRQNGDGTTDWVKRGHDGAQVVHPVGAKYLTVQLSDVSTASTVAVAIPVTDMRVSYIQTVIATAITTAAAEFAFTIYDNVGVIRQEITNGTARASIATESIAGTLAAFTPTKASASNHVGQGDVIHINTNGASTVTSVGTITITLVPR